MDWTKLPKVELHLHLDCSLSYDVVSQIDPSITLEEYRRNFNAPAKCLDLRDFSGACAQQFPADADRRASPPGDVGPVRAASQGQCLVCPRSGLLPCFIWMEGLLPIRLLAAWKRQLLRLSTTPGSKHALFFCTLRYFSGAQSLETVHLVEDFRGTYVAGFDIAADQPGDVITPHLAAFQYARDQAIPYTAHAGETRGLENVKDTLQHFAPSRLGHGVCSITDPVLLEEIRQRKVHLEACPSCNVQTNCYDSYADHPVDKLYRAGFPLA